MKHKARKASDSEKRPRRSCCWTRRRHLCSWRILGTSKHKFKSQFSLLCWSIRCLYLIHNFLVSDLRPIHVIIISFLQYRIRHVPNLRECHFWLHSTWNQLWTLAVLFPHFYILVIKTDLWDLWSRIFKFLWFGTCPYPMSAACGLLPHVFPYDTPVTSKIHVDVRKLQAKFM